MLFTLMVLIFAGNFLVFEKKLHFAGINFRELSEKLVFF